MHRFPHAAVRARRSQIRWSVAALFLGSALATAQVHAQGTSPMAVAPGIATVTAVNVEGNTLLSEETIRAVTARAIGQSSMETFKAVTSALQAEYRKGGFGGVVVVIPQQNLASGTLLLRVLEGKVANVRVQGNQHVSVGNVRAGIPSLREGDTPRLDRLDREVQLSNESPTKDVRVTLAAGAKRGEIDADVQVKDHPPLQFIGSYSNTGDESTGRHRVSVGVRHSNLFDRDHVGTVQYQTSPDHRKQVSVLSAGYRVPLYSPGISVDAFAAYSDVSLGNTITPAGPLDFTGRGTIIGLRANYSLPRVAEIDQRVTVGADVRNYRNVCSLGTLGAAGCGPSGVSVRTFPLSVSYSVQTVTPTGSGGGNLGLYWNAGGSDDATFDAARPGARRHYVVTRGSGFGQWALPEGFGVALRGEMQLTADRLISAEKFGLGGAASVRGYRERELTGDIGYFIRVEGLGPDVALAAVHVRPLVFFDHGRVSNRDDMPCRGLVSTRCALSSVGLGARAQLAPYASGSLEVGRALNSASATEKGDWRVHASINVIY